MKTICLSRENSKIKVSSVLNKDSKQFGKDFLFDDNLETCWNSDTGTGQFIKVKMNENWVVKNLAGIQLMFQGAFHFWLFVINVFLGGFAGKNCEFWALERQTGSAHSHIGSLITHGDGRNDINAGASSTTDPTDPAEKLTKWCDFYPADSNSIQSFHFSNLNKSNGSSDISDSVAFSTDEVKKTENLVNEFKILFKDSSDFYGRIVVYQVKLICNDMYQQTMSGDK